MKSSVHTSIVDSADLERTLLGRSIGEKLDLTFRQSDQVKTASLSLVMNPRGNRLPQQQYTVAKPAPAQPAAGVQQPNANVAVPASDKSWEMLGMRLTPIPNGVKTLANQHYRGGLLVTEVRGTSPAESNGIGTVTSWSACMCGKPPSRKMWTTC